MQPNKLYHGDNREVLSSFPDECINLIYLDPPFYTQRDFVEFNDKWSRGPQEYLDFMNVRIRDLHRVLKSTGSIYLHCDQHANHHLKLLMDKIFGVDNFLNEIIWNSANVSGFKSQKNGWIREHDTIFHYVKGDNYTFNKQYEPYTEEYIKQKFRFLDKGGKYRMMRGEKKVYLHETQGKMIGDVWTFPRISHQEFLGYDTQKPEALLERIILASSNEGDLILDPFSGSGTTLKVARRLKRNFVGIDVNPNAIKLCEGIDVIRLPNHGARQIVDDATVEDDFFL